MLLGGAVFSNIEKEKQEKLKVLENATPSDLLPYGDLADKFNLMSEHTDIQRENTEKEIKGKVVEWMLTVYEIDKSSSGYRIQTQSDSAVGTFIDLVPRNDAERSKIEALKTGDTIKFRGYINGTTLRHIEISPAALVGSQASKIRPVPVQEQSGQNQSEKSSLPSQATRTSSETFEQTISKEEDVVDETKAMQEKIGGLGSATPSMLLPYGALEEFFSSPLQGDPEGKALKKLKDVVVEWVITVGDVSKSDTEYIVGSSKKYHEIPTTVYLTPRTDEERLRIESLKKGDTIKFRGYIDDPMMMIVVPGILKIRPAILIAGDSLVPAELAHIKELESSSISEQLSYGELKNNFRRGSDQTEFQHDNALSKFEGKIVEWEIPARDLTGENIFMSGRQFDSLTTARRIHVESSVDCYLETIIHIVPRNDIERSKLNTLNQNDKFRIRGHVEYFADRTCMIDYAILITGKDEKPIAQEVKPEQTIETGGKKNQDAASSSERVDLGKVLVGKWNTSYGRYSETLTFEPDGTFCRAMEIVRGPSEDAATESTGKWKLTGRELVFTTKDGATTEKIRFSSSNAFEHQSALGAEGVLRYEREEMRKEAGLPTGEKLDNAIISAWSTARIRYEINTIYARHGVEFPDRKIQEWADQQPWYHRVPGRDYAMAESLFTETERNNIELLGQARAAKGKEAVTQPTKGPWIFPDSSQRRLSKADLVGLNAEQLWQARNEIYARNGLIFSTPKGQAFSATLGDQYRGTDNSQEQVFGRMTEIEKANLEMIKKTE